MSNTVLEQSYLRKIYHEILILEARKLGNNENCIENDLSDTHMKTLCHLINTSYCINYDELVDTASRITNSTELAKNPHTNTIHQ